MKISMTVLRRHWTGAVFVGHVDLVVEDTVEVVVVVEVVDVDEVVVSKFSFIQSIYDDTRVFTPFS